MAGQPLDSLLRPHSIAVVGASERPGSPGNETLVNLLAGNYSGQIFAVNPSRQAIGNLPCYPTLRDLPAVPEQVVFVVGEQHLEALFDEAVALGVRACTIFSALQLEDDHGPGIAARIRDKADEAGVLLHGANCMGFFNFRDGVRVSGFDTREHKRPGNVALLSQSGAGMSGIMDCEERLDFLFAASTGQELQVSLEDYLEFVLELPETRVVGLFLETSRHPERFIAALARAAELGIPIVVVKVGRTALASELAVSHSGALAGSDATFQAVFDRYGVQRVDDMAQLATSLIMFAQPYAIGTGGLVSLHDSGGERQLAIDLAAQVGVSYAQLESDTVANLSGLLDAGLPAVNPLDAWSSGGADAEGTMRDCFSVLLNDANAALGAVVHDRAPGAQIYPAYLEYLRSANKQTRKPVFLVANHGGSGADPLALQATREGLTVLDGLSEFLVGARCLMNFRDFQSREEASLLPLDTGSLNYWREALTNREWVDEAMAGALLRDFGLPVVAGHSVTCAEDLLDLPDHIDYPVVLKTAVPGLLHKSSRGGVILGLKDHGALLAAYMELAERLGKEALVCPMVDGEGQEMILGIANDAQFGATIVMGIGGVHTEVLADAVTLLPPFCPETARKALDRLKFRPLLDVVTLAPALEDFCLAASRLSQLAIALGDVLAEVDINPIKLTAGGCFGLDSLAVVHRPRND